MAINNRLGALIFRIILFIGCIIGIILNMFIDGNLSLSIFIYYTIQSNILCLVVISIVIIDTIKKIKSNGTNGSNLCIPKIKGATTMAITITFLVFHFMLRPTLFDMGLGDYATSPANFMVHYFTPIMFIMDYLLFDKKNNYGWKDPLTWIAIPLVYFVFSIIRAAIGGIIRDTDSRYPYFFIDIDLYGWKVAFYVFGLIVFFLIVGYIIMFIDRIYYDNGLKLRRVKDKIK